MTTVMLLTLAAVLIGACLRVGSLVMLVMAITTVSVLAILAHAGLLHSVILCLVSVVAVQAGYFAGTGLRAWLGRFA